MTKGPPYRVVATGSWNYTAKWLSQCPPLAEDETMWTARKWEHRLETRAGDRMRGGQGHSGKGGRGIPVPTRRIAAPPCELPPRPPPGKPRFLPAVVVQRGVRRGSRTQERAGLPEGVPAARSAPETRPLPPWRTFETFRFPSVPVLGNLFLACQARSNPGAAGLLDPARLLDPALR